ncbi:MAG: DsbA family protein [Bacteroidota bacterium]
MALLKEVPLATQGQLPDRGITLYYFYDALCGWCYGFSPVIARLADERTGEDLRLEVISGNMVPDEGAQPIAGMAQYILSAIPRLEEMTGVQMGEAYKAILRDGSRVYSSGRPGRALAWWKTQEPTQQAVFAGLLQKGIFQEGLPTEGEALYRFVAEKLDIDPNGLLQALDDEQIAYAANSEAQFARELGITGFPALVALKEGKFYLLARGYVSEATLFQQLDTLVKQ